MSDISHEERVDLIESAFEWAADADGNTWVSDRAEQEFSKLLSDYEAGHKKIAYLEQELQNWIDACSATLKELAAAHSRIEELERML